VTGWEQALEGFAADMKASPRKSLTGWQYGQHVRWLASSVTTGPWELTSHELAAWLDERNWSRETRRKVLVSLRVFYGWAVAEGLCLWAPTAGLPAAAPNKRGSKRRLHAPVWEEAIADFIDWGRSGNRTEGTLGIRAYWLGRLAEVSADPWAVTMQQLATWLSCPDWAPETKRAARNSVRTFYRWAVLAGRLEVSPAEQLDSVLVARGLPRPAPDKALREALAAADDRQRLMIKLAAYAGLRRAEIANLHTRQISDTELLVVGKGGHHRRVPLHPDLADELRAELARRRAGRCGSGWGAGRFVSEHGFLFPSDNDPGPLTPAHVGVLVSRLLPQGWTCHTLRHRFATAAYAVERDLRAVQELLGHAKPETTARYAAVPEGALRTAVAGVAVSRW
jgi:integrase/recombinase XerC